MNHPQPPFIPIDLKIDETMDGAMQAVGRAVELKRASTHEADRAAILMIHESARIRSIRGGPECPCKASPGLWRQRDETSRVIWKEVRVWYKAMKK